MISIQIAQLAFPEVVQRFCTIDHFAAEMLAAAASARISLHRRRGTCALSDNSRRCMPMMPGRLGLGQTPETQFFCPRLGLKPRQLWIVAVNGVAPGHSQPDLLAVHIQTPTCHASQQPVVFIVAQLINSGALLQAESRQGLLGLHTKGLIHFRRINGIEPNYVVLPILHRRQGVAIVYRDYFPGPAGHRRATRQGGDSQQQNQQPGRGYGHGHEPSVTRYQELLTIQFQKQIFGLDIHQQRAARQLVAHPVFFHVNDHKPL